MRRQRSLAFAVGAVVGALVACGPDRKDDHLDREGEECLFNNIERSCGEDDRGFQYCEADERGDLRWGPCLDASELECRPGDILECPGYNSGKICTVQDWVPTFGDCPHDTDEGPYTSGADQDTGTARGD